ncbi:hypothetical protein QBC34DRAFT_260327, partial [Podospora aff. communis PSN243]
PTTSASYGFRLVLNLTSPSDLTPPIHNTYLNLAHIGPAQNRAIALPTPGPIFYQNGTSSASSLSFTTTLTDGGTPPFPEGITYSQLPNSTQGAAVFITAGSGAQNVKLTRLFNPLSYLTVLDEVVGSTFVVCDGRVEYYGEKEFQVINWVTTTRDATGMHLVVPEGCVGVNLVPECAVLEALPGDARASHEWAQEVRCYEDVKGVGW